MVMVAAGRDEGGLGAVALGQLEAEHAAVEGERPLEVGHLEVDVADARAGVDRPIRLTLVRHGPQGFGGHAKPPVGLGNDCAQTASLCKQQGPSCDQRY